MPLEQVAFHLARFANRVVSPVMDTRRAIAALKDIPWFVRSYAAYARAAGQRPKLANLYPCLGDRKTDAGTATGDYFHQDLWAARKVFQSGVSEHVDVGSRVDGFVAHCAVFTKVIYVDLRPLPSDVPNITSRIGSFDHLPFEDGSVPSLSSLHVVEHIGLGRYGDPLDPGGTTKAMLELRRVLAPGGNLFLGLPIGQERVEFNAHRITNPETVLGAMEGLELVDFAAVEKNGRPVSHCRPQTYRDVGWAFGLFHFRRS